MSTYCLKCLSNPCKCGEIYKTIKKEHIYKTIMACAEALKERFNENIEITINGEDFKKKFMEVWKEPLFPTNVLQLINGEFVPRKWNSVLEKSETLDDLLFEINKSDEDDFPLRGILLFITNAFILIRDNKSTTDLFINIVKQFYDRETPIRELIEQCGSNYNALYDKLNDIIKEDPELNKYDCVYSITHKYIREDKEGRIKDSICFLIYQLVQCYTLGNVADIFWNIKQYQDEFFYADETIFNTLCNIEKPIESDIISLK